MRCRHSSKPPPLHSALESLSDCPCLRINHLSGHKVRGFDGCPSRQDCPFVNIKAGNTALRRNLATGKVAELGEVDFFGAFDSDADLLDGGPIERMRVQGNTIGQVQDGDRMANTPSVPERHHTKLYRQRATSTDPWPPLVWPVHCCRFMCRDKLCRKGSRE